MWECAGGIRDDGPKGFGLSCSGTGITEMGCAEGTWQKQAWASGWNQEFGFRHDKGRSFLKSSCMTSWHLYISVFKAVELDEIT